MACIKKLNKKLTKNPFAFFKRVHKKPHFVLYPGIVSKRNPTLPNSILNLISLASEKRFAKPKFLNQKCKEIFKELLPFYTKKQYATKFAQRVGSFIVPSKYPISSDLQSNVLFQAGLQGLYNYICIYGESNKICPANKACNGRLSGQALIGIFNEFKSKYGINFTLRELCKALRIELNQLALFRPDYPATYDTLLSRFGMDMTKSHLFIPPHSIRFAFTYNTFNPWVERNHPILAYWLRQQYQVLYKSKETSASNTFSKQRRYALVAPKSLPGA